MLQRRVHGINGGDILDELITTICRAYLLVLSIYHVFTGCISYFFPENAIRFYESFYDCKPPHPGQLKINLRPWGALALFAGIAGLFAAHDPFRYFGVVLGLCILLALRIGYRFLLRDALYTISGIAPHRNYFNIAIITLGVVILSTWMCIG
jgi:hypothetical protein